MKSIIKYRETFFENWYQFDSKFFFVILCILYLLILLLKRTFVIADIAAFEVLQDRGEMWVFDLFFGLQYLTVPFFIAWRITLTSFVVWVGCFMFGYRITYAQLWRWVMFAELVFIIPEFLKLFWFILSSNDPNYQDIVAFYPLSLINLIDYQNVGSAFHYPLKALNIFEVLYWYVLMIGVYFLSGKEWKQSVLIVSSTYILFFFVWLGYYMIVYK
ncbi:MAG: hypothetical protein ACI8QD_001344 [Cyclobacteriaceae bacterium]|jgi:hypothetical protein